MKYIIEGEPIAWQRPKGGWHGKRYDGQKLQKELIAWQVKAQGGRVLTVPLRVKFVFYTQLPKRGKAEGDPRPARPDLSNYIKLYEDALNGILWADDSLIIEIHAIKVYSMKPRTEIEIYE